MKRLTPEVVRQMHLGRTPQAVMILILQKARGGTGCYYSQADLARAVVVDERTIRRALASLVSVGLISRVPRKDKRGYRSTDLITIHHDAWSVVPKGRAPSGQNVRLALDL